MLYVKRLSCCPGLTPIKLFLDERNVRAWPGGVGDCKVGSNYAPTILPQTTAQQLHGTPQVGIAARILTRLLQLVEG